MEKSSTSDAASKARRFLNFAHASSDFVAVGKSNPETGNWLGYQSLNPRDDDAISALITEAETTNIFVTPAEMDSTGDCLAENVVGSFVAWVDIDPPKDESQLPEHLEWLKTTAVPELKKLGAWVNRSGREGGRHAYVKLSRQVTPDEVRALNKLLVARFRGDSKCANPNRVLRLPGTINHKTGERVTRSLGKNRQKWDPEALAEELGADKPLSELAEESRSTPLTDVGDVEPEPVKWSDYGTLRSEAVRKPNLLFREGVQPTRHKLIAGSVFDCYRRGLSFAQTLWVLGHCTFATEKAEEEGNPLSHYVAWAWKEAPHRGEHEVTADNHEAPEDESLEEDDTLEEDDGGPDRFQALDWEEAFSKDFSRIDWLPGKLLERSQQVALIADGKVGKSLFIEHWGFALTLGWDFLGDEARKPLRVLYFDKENSMRDVITRARALGVKPEDLPKLAQRFDYRQFPRFDGTLDDPNKQAAEEFHEIVEESEPDVVIIDTASRFIGGSENDANTWLQLYQLIHERLKKRGIACVRLDHFGKDSSVGGRGSSAKSQDVDHVWEMTIKGSYKEGNTETTTLALKRTHTRTGYGNDQLFLTRVGVKDDKGMWAEGQTTHTLEVLGSGEPAKESNVMAAKSLEIQEDIYNWVLSQEEAPSTSQIQKHFSDIPARTLDGHLISLLEDTSGHRLTRSKKRGEENKKTAPWYYRAG